MRHRMPYFYGAYELVRHRMSISVAHVLVRHRMLIFVVKILWSTTHTPQNTYIGAPQMRFFLLVSMYFISIFANLPL
jgi:hypothetical protein